MRACGREFSPEAIGWIQQTIDREPELSRRALSRRICGWLNWRSLAGKLKEMSCRAALGKLERRGHIRMPPAAVFSRPNPARPVRADAAGDGPAEVACRLAAVQPVEVLPVGGPGSPTSRVWNELMARYHPLGAGPLCGAQIRYLIRSATQGWLGGLAFSAAAWRVEARDRWIGWTEAARQQHLHQVLANSRLLILPHVRVPHLASHVLGQAVRRLPEDWQARYGYKPLLVETYVEEARYQGTCYRAANWIPVGTTKGRGRQDRTHQRAAPVKRVFVYALQAQARARLGTAEAVADGPAAPASPPVPVDWAEEEFGAARLGDERLTQRLLVMARDFYARPRAQIPQACQSRAKTKAAYRFLTHPKTTMDRVLESHVAATSQRIAKERIVLAVQDTTSLNYSTHPATENLGPIGSRPDGLIGVLVHDTMAFSVEGTPLGLLDVQCWARDAATFGKKHQRRQQPIEQKESHKWLQSFRRVAEVQARCPHTTLVSVGDREADIYELFHLALKNPAGPKLLVRAEQDRLVADGHGQLWPTVQQQPLAGEQELSVPRRGSQPRRLARLEIRVAHVTLKPPQSKSGYGPLTLWAVLAQEVAAPDGLAPLSWMLLTTCPVTDFAAATETLNWYTKRWGIEIYHRTLKSGCQIEERQLGSADSIEACLAIDMVVAWRIYHLTKLGREVPDVPCTVFFEEAEWKALHIYITKNPVPPAEPPSLRQAIRMVASLGGFLGRKGDGEPGTQTLWLGLQRVDDLAAMWKILVPHLRAPPVSSNPTYG
ncbi:MAG TPA: IS4 family transposase [Vicinamibacteria bacterium]